KNIIKLLKLYDEISHQDIQDYLQESKSKIRLRLTVLIELGLTGSRGKGRAVTYHVIVNNRKIMN
ncbi:MAG: hypothetical protein R3205_06010, partial [Psychrobacter sp.]|nr:hypothetical protein [Psychrobacter sp.]